MIPIRCFLIGGPFDGVWLVIGPDDYLPESWWVREDPESRGPFGLVASFRCPAGERYVLSAFEGGPEAFYQHESVTTSVSTREVEAFA
jgi:hypothetical protein